MSNFQILWLCENWKIRSFSKQLNKGSMYGGGAPTGPTQQQMYMEM